MTRDFAVAPAAHNILARGLPDEANALPIIVPTELARSGILKDHGRRCLFSLIVVIGVGHFDLDEQRGAAHGQRIALIRHLRYICGLLAALLLHFDQHVTHVILHD